MPAYFTDSSGLVKRYATETGTTWVKSIVTPAAGNTVVVAEITTVEVVAALSRRAKNRIITPQDVARMIAAFRNHVACEYIIVEMTRAIFTRAAHLAEQHALRGYDAIQLAAALDANGERAALGLTELVLISADAELNQVAIVEGLAVENPNDDA